jgi:hypothetical protein
MTVEPVRRVRKDPRPEFNVFTSSAQQDFNVGFDYLAIVMQEIDSGISMNSGLYGRVQASSVHDAHITFSIQEVADSLRNDSADTLTPEMMISKTSSKSHPELALELKQLVMTSSYPYTSGGSIPQNKASISGTDTTESDDVR